MEDGDKMSAHLDKFDELMMSMEAVGETMDEQRMMTILLGSLPQEYDTIVAIIENLQRASMLDVKEKLLKEYEKHQRQEKTESAFVSKHNRKRQNRPNHAKGNKKGVRIGYEKFTGKCHRCHKVGHKAKECWSKIEGHDTGNGETVFLAHDGPKYGWLLDSGASSHMTSAREDFVEYRKLTQPVLVTVADGNTMKAVGRGTVQLKSNNGRTVTIRDTLHIPDLNQRLLSVPVITTRGFDVKFNLNVCTIWNGDELIASAKRNGKSYVLNAEHELAMYVSHEGISSEWELWHARLGHTHHDNYQKTQEATVGLPKIKTKSENLCGGCLKGKMTIATFPKMSTTKTTAPLQLIHSDVMGPMKTIATGGSKYAVTFIDDYSGFVSVYFMKGKDEVPTKFTEFKTEMERQSGTVIKTLRADNGGEYRNKRMESICKNDGIIHQRTVPYSPQQNGVAERMNRTIVEKARSMMHYKGVERKWWAEAMNTAVYLINRSTNTSNSTKTPFELRFNMKPQLSHLRVFGSLGYAHIDDSKRTKFDPKSYRCMMLGYVSNTKGYKVYDLETKQVKTSRSIVLDEREVGGIYENDQVVVMKYSNTPSNEGDDDWVIDNAAVLNDGDVVMEDIDNDDDVEMIPVDSNKAAIEPNHSPVQISQHSVNTESWQQPSGRRHQELIEPPVQSDAIVFRPSVTRRRRDNHMRILTDDTSGRNDGTAANPNEQTIPRIEQPMTMLLESGHVRQTNADNSNEPTIPRIEQPVRMLIEADPVHQSNGTDDVNDDEEPPIKRTRHDSDMDWAFIVGDGLNVNDIPQSYDAAISGEEHEQWIKAIDKEFAAHDRNKTWTIVKQMPRMKIIGTKWVFNKKWNGTGIQYKARLVALGNLQHFGVDFYETYAAVANVNSVRMILAICCAKGYIIEQIDVDTAYLNADLEEDVYIKAPEGLNVKDNVVLKLKKALYGLKQAASAWNKTIHKFLIEIGFSSCGGDRCVYKRQGKSGWVYVCLYVDDMIVGANRQECVDTVKSQIAKRFPIKDLGTIKYVLGMKIEYNPESRTMHINQQQYILNTAEIFNQVGARRTENPCDPGTKLSNTDAPRSDIESIQMKRTPYRQLIGRLMYIATCTRPDIMFVVNQLSRFSENPGALHWKAAVKVLRYINTTRNYGICYNGNQGEPQLVGYSDADWGSNIDDRRSVSGVILMMCGGPIVFKSKYQKSVSLSSAEAEYMALSLCVQEVIWARKMMKDLGVLNDKRTTIWEDNQGAIALTVNSGYHARTKHIDIKYHFVREAVASGEIDVKYKESQQQLADILTKPLGTKRFQYLREHIGIKLIIC